MLKPASQFRTEPLTVKKLLALIEQIGFQDAQVKVHDYYDGLLGNVIGVYNDNEFDNGVLKSVLVITVDHND